MKSHSLIVLALIVLFFSCKKETATYQSKTGNNSTTGIMLRNNETRTYKGPEVMIGNGKGRSLIVLDEKGNPLSLTIELNNEALTGLPDEETEYVLPLHRKAREATPFDHITVNWNPHGHEPEHVYDLPHFDFHFYKVSLHEQQSIPPYGPATAALFDNFPPMGYLPATYVPIPGGVPQMGKHWVDVTSPELNGQPFTKTFIYGTYNGQVTFFEPMATLALLQSNAASEANISQPQLFAPTGNFYPGAYRIDADGGNHYISLNNFTWQP